MVVSKQSAGILLYKLDDKKLMVLLVHPGGPFWAKRDNGVWSVPKGEFNDGEAPLTAARREFIEETGLAVPEGEPYELGSVKNASGKTIYAWALAGDFDASKLKSNLFEMEWPPKSGQNQSFPEVDRAGWFDPKTAKQKLTSSQAPFIDRLLEQLGLSSESATEKPDQTTLL